MTDNVEPKPNGTTPWARSWRFIKEHAVLASLITLVGTILITLTVSEYNTAYTLGKMDEQLETVQDNDLRLENNLKYHGVAITGRDGLQVGQARLEVKIDTSNDNILQLRSDMRDVLKRLARIEGKLNNIAPHVVREEFDKEVRKQQETIRALMADTGRVAELGVVLDTTKEELDTVQHDIRRLIDALPTALLREGAIDKMTEDAISTLKTLLEQTDTNLGASQRRIDQSQEEINTIVAP